MCTTSTWPALLASTSGPVPSSSRAVRKSTSRMAFASRCAASP
jgi:hypothetical protein